MKGIFKTICLLVVVSFFLSSCGNKGDLYLPKKDKDNTDQTDK